MKFCLLISEAVGLSKSHVFLSLVYNTIEPYWNEHLLLEKLSSTCMNAMNVCSGSL